MMKERPSDLEVEIEPISEALKAGLIVGYHGTEEFVMLRLFADRRLHVIRVSSGFSWDWLLRTTAVDAPAGQFDRMAARIENQTVVLSVNGEDVFTLDQARDVEGSFGFNLEGSDLRLRVLP